MIRTFIIYKMVDKCLDLFFDRIESVFIPLVGLRIGARYRKIIVDRSVFDNSTTEYRITEFHDCTLVRTRYNGTGNDYSLIFNVRLIESTYRFKTVSAANHFVSLNPHKQYNATDDDLVVSFYMYPKHEIGISSETFQSAEKYAY